MVIEKYLTDAEHRLFLLYRRICVWDRLKENFGTSEASIRDIRATYLPEWSIGKISRVRNSLVIKNWLVRLDRTKFGVAHPNVWYARKMKEVEQGVQLIEQAVQSPEQAVPPREQRRALAAEAFEAEHEQVVLPIEQALLPKEPIKETLKNLRESSDLPDFFSGEPIFRNIKL